VGAHGAVFAKWAFIYPGPVPLARCYVVAKGLCHRKQMLRTHVVCMHVFACVCVCVCVRVVVDVHVRARARLCAHICCELACLQ
jgi:hypothetical protein